LHQQRALPDAEERLDADAGQAGLVLAQDVLVALRLQLSEARPLLAGPVDVLALVLADDAASRRLIARSVLDGAYAADVRVHRPVTLSEAKGLAPPTGPKDASLRSA